MNRSAAETREHVLDVASDLFYWNGIRATGIDRVAAEADIAPTSLYRAFPSKDALIEAYVDAGDAGARARAESAVATAGPSARDRILAEFDALGGFMHADTCRGCSSQMTLAEFPDPGSAGRQRALQAKTAVAENFRALAAEHLNGGTRADLLGDQLFVVYEGLAASAMSGDPQRMVGPTRALVELMLDSAVA
jgi:AcrR family transcriptional regulator